MRLIIKECIVWTSLIDEFEDDDVYDDYYSHGDDHPSNQYPNEYYPTNEDNNDYYPSHNDDKYDSELIIIDTQRLPINRDIRVRYNGI